MAARNFRCQRIVFMGMVIYRLSWVVDRYYSGSRLRFPKVYTRETDEKGAKRFCRRRGIEFPTAQTGDEN